MSDAAGQVGSSVDALSRQFDIIAHNLANVSTVGYKRRCAAFSESLGVQQQAANGETSGSISSNGVFDFSQGHIVQTDRPLDFALFGKGFFVVETPEGPLYTRNGTFHINQDNQIVNSDGNIIAGQAGPIIVPPSVGLSQISVSSDGAVSAPGVTIGTFRLVDFEDNQNKLVPVGAGCYQAPQAVVPVDAQNIVVRQGAQEASNVKMIDELVNLITVSRLYEANMKYVTAQKDTSSSIISVAAG